MLSGNKLSLLLDKPSLVKFSNFPIFSDSVVN